ncbi:hypothetical protein GCM10009565_85070 [Amycolatopsis albidoflavus]
MADASSRGPAVCYRLDAPIDRASDNGVLPHLLAIAALAAQPQNANCPPGTDLILPDGGTPEVDIFGVHNARVLAGEVKTRATDFTTGQPPGDVNLSKRLDAGTHLLAAIDTLPADTAKAVAPGHG